MDIRVADFYKVGREEIGLEVECGLEDMERPIHEAVLNRPGLALSGFFQYFANRRIQVMGLAENAYLKSLDYEAREKNLKAMLEHHVPCVIMSRNRHAPPELLQWAKMEHVPVFRSPLITSELINNATLLLDRLTAPTKKAAGTMVDVMGVGVLIEGQPGIGKSETALSLIERGYSLVSDDITVLRREGQSIYGYPVEITRYHLEIRGLGIVHVPSLFGVSSLRRRMQLDLIVRLHHPEPEENEERTGINPPTRTIFGCDIPVFSLAVNPGRDIAHVVQVAALNAKLKNLGHDAAKELDERIVQRLLEHGH